MLGELLTQAATLSARFWMTACALVWACVVLGVLAIARWGELREERER